MKKRFAIFAVAAALSASGVHAQSASSWEIGPVINGRSYSPGMPRTMSDGSRGPTFQFPTSEREGHVHYVTRAVGSLSEAQRITLRYRIDAGQGARFIPRERPEETASLSMYFQRRGDTWQADRAYGDYRWYAAAPVSLRPGTHTVTVEMRADDWIPVSRSGSDDFATAKALAGRAKFPFGWRGGRGHGVYATAPAQFTLLSFEID